MRVVSATEFVNAFGKFNQDVQTDTIQVTSHGRPVGYYLSAKDYDLLMQGNSGKRASLKKDVLSNASLIKAIARKHNALHIRLFGSVMREEDDQNSDVDFLVAFPEVYDLFEDRCGLANALEDLLGRRVDILVEGEINKDIRDSILAEAVEL